MSSERVIQNSTPLAENPINSGSVSEETNGQVVFLHPRFTFNLIAREITGSDSEIPTHLSPNESGVLAVLIQNANRVLTYQQIKLAASGSNFVLESPVKIYISTLRRKIPDNDKDNPIIENVFGKGYKLQNPYEQTPDDEYHHPTFTFSAERQSLNIEGIATRLSPTETRILQLLTENENNLVTDKKIAREAFGIEIFDESAYSSVKQYISYLRKKIRTGREIDDCIETVWGKGYKLNNLEKAQEQNNFEFCQILNSMEKTVLQFTADGLSLQEIAAKMNEQPDFISYLRVRIGNIGKNRARSNKLFPGQTQSVILALIQDGIANGYLTHKIHPEERIGELTKREYEILDLVSQGLSAQEITSKLQISLVTVKYHNANIRNKLNTTNDYHTVARATYLKVHSLLPPKD